MSLFKTQSTYLCKSKSRALLFIYIYIYIYIYISKSFEDATIYIIASHLNMHVIILGLDSYKIITQLLHNFKVHSSGVYTMSFIPMCFGVV
jgi:hypothetical protein